MDLKHISLNEIIEKNKSVKFPDGCCCGNICRDCRYMEMDNNHYNDGTRRCSWLGEWKSPYSPACHKFTR